MLNIFNFGKIKLVNGVELKPINIKFNYEKLMEFYNQDTTEFKNLEFLQAENFAASSVMYKQYAKSKIKVYLIFDNNLPVGVIEVKNFQKSFFVTSMVDQNYSDSQALKIAVNFFVKKYSLKNEIILKISNYDVNTINNLKSIGINGNIFFISNKKCFLFVGQDFENVRENDWQDTSEVFAFQNFFSNEWSNQNQVNVNEPEKSDVNFEKQKSQVEFNDLLQDEHYEDLEKNENSNQENQNSNQVDNLENISEDEINIDETYNNYNLQEQIVPSQSSLVSSSENTKVLSQKDFVVDNISKTIKEISQIPETENYSKVNSELFSTIKNTSTFKSFEDSSIQKLKFKQQNLLNSTSKNPRISIFEQKLAEIKEKRKNQMKNRDYKNQFTANLKKPWQEDKSFYESKYLNYKAKEKSNNDIFNKTELEKSKPIKTKGFGSRVMNI